MKHKISVSRSLMLPLGVLAMVLFAGTAWGQLGINFSVLTGAQGLPGTGVNGASGDGAHIYVGGGNNNVIRIPLSALGLVPGDEVDAISIPYPGVTPTIDEVLFGGTPGFIFFSVDANAVGMMPIAPPDVFTEALVPEAAGDVFLAQPFVVAPWNTQAYDEVVIGLDQSPVPVDDQDALDLIAPILTYPLPLGAVAFSLAAGSPSLGPGITEDDILVTDGAGGFLVIATGAALGIPPGDDLDALFVDAALAPLFSVRGGSGVLFPGDIYLPNGVLDDGSDGLADLLVAAWQLGLYDPMSGPAPWDNLNALDALMDVLGLPPDPDEVDTDGDELPDYWEEREKLDPNDDGSVDPDMGGDGDPDEDGYTNKEEYDNDTDPWEFDAGGLPVMQPWPVTIVVALVVIAFAAVTLTYRRRLA